MSSRWPVSQLRPHRFWSIEYGDRDVTLIGSPFSSANAIALSLVMPESRTGASTWTSRARLAMPTSNLTWSLPLPVHPGQVGDDQRPRERRDQRVTVHVERVGGGRGQAVAGRELLPRVHHLGGHGTARQGPVADHGQVLAALANVDHDRDHLGAGPLGDPADGDRGVQATGICEHYAFCHDCFLVSAAAGSPVPLIVLAPVAGGRPR